MEKTIVIKSKNIFTGLTNEPFEGAVFVEKNKIIDIIETSNISKYEDGSCQIYDVGQRLVMPGFIDAHMHFFQAAVADSEYINTDIINSTSEDDCIEMMKEYRKKHPELKRLVGMGWFPVNWHDAPLPSKKSVDEAFPDIPVYLVSADVHTIWLNSMAINECGITTKTTVKCGEIGKDDKGELTGLLFEKDANDIAMNQILNIPKDELKKVFMEFQKNLVSKGITSTSDMTANKYEEIHYDHYRLFKEMAESGQVTSRVHVYTYLEEPDLSIPLGLQKKYNSDLFRISGLKSFVDGVTSTYTGLLLEPYTDRPDTTGIGTPIVPKEELEEFVINGNRAGLPVRLHCIADGSVRLALDVFEASNNANPGHGLNNTIEHIETIHPADIKRFKELKVIPSLQPRHLILDENEKISRCGEERSKLEWPHRSILDAGGEMALGTDYPVVDYDPFVTIYMAMTRCDENGNPTGINPEEKISLHEALTAYTKNAAKAYSREDELGTFEPGKLADIVVVDGNLFQMDPSEIKDASVFMTMMNGDIVYRKQ